MQRWCGMKFVCATHGMWDSTHCSACPDCCRDMRKELSALQQGAQKAEAEKVTLTENLHKAVVMAEIQRNSREKAEATSRKMEIVLVRQAAAAKAGMDAATEVSKWQMEEARRLKSECSPASVAGQREANEKLTQELDAANATSRELADRLNGMEHKLSALTQRAESAAAQRYGLARMLLHYVRSVPLGNQPHMSAEPAEKMALEALALAGWREA